MRHYGRSLTGEDGTQTMLKNLNLNRLLVCFCALCFYVTNIHQHADCSSSSRHGPYPHCSSNGSLIAILQVMLRKLRQHADVADDVTHWQRLQRSVCGSNKNFKTSVMSKQSDDGSKQNDDGTKQSEDFVGACKRLQERIVR
jgi:hypothetical protein